VVRALPATGEPASGGRSSCPCLRASGTAAACAIQGRYSREILTDRGPGA